MRGNNSSFSLKHVFPGSIKKFVAHFGWVLVIIVLFGLQRVVATRPDLVEDVYVGFLREPTVSIMNLFNSFVPFSLTETVILVGVFVGVLWGIRYVILERKKVEPRFRVKKKQVVAAGWALAGIYSVFMMVHGFNYSRETVAVHFDFTEESVTVPELMHVGEQLVSEANALRETLKENEEGEFIPTTSLVELLGKGSEGYRAASVVYGTLGGDSPRVKPVILSRYWSHFRTTGMYFPLFSEVNVNTHPPAHEVLEATLHELAHSKGYAREDEANFVAFIAGIYHPDPDYKYAVLVQNTKRILTQLRLADEEAYQELENQLSEKVAVDIESSRKYWANYGGLVGATTVEVNNIFLKANAQSDGVASYGNVVDSIVNWYFSGSNSDYLREEQGSLSAEVMREEVNNGDAPVVLAK